MTVAFDNKHMAGHPVPHAFSTYNVGYVLAQETYLTFCHYELPE